jgi:hypothetical protein
MITRKVRELRIHGTDEYDRREQKKQFYITTSREDMGMIFTDAPMKYVYKFNPEHIYIDVSDMKGTFVALYTNSLCTEDYIHEYAKSVEVGPDGKTWVNDSLYFRRKPGAPLRNVE